MIRRVLRRLLGGSPPKPTPPPPRATPAPAPVVEEAEPALEVEGPELARWVAEGDVLLLDIREPGEVAGGFAEGSWLLPMNQVPDRLAELPRGRIGVICAAGARSYGVAHYLREQGFSEAWSLAGGVGALLDAGVPCVFTPSDAAFRLLTPVRLHPEAATARGLAAEAAGSVQRVHSGPDGHRYAVRLREGPLVEDLRAEELQAIGRAR